MRTPASPLGRRPLCGGHAAFRGPHLRRAPCVLPGLLLVASLPVSAALVDRDGDGSSDFFQVYYQLPSLDPNADDDGDGQINRFEETAGSNPWNATAHFRIQSISIERVVGTHQLAIALDSVMGKSYQAQQAVALERPRWLDIGEPFHATETGRIHIRIPLDAAQSPGFIRVSVSDRDEDGDGLNAFEEILIGTSDRDPGSGVAAGANWLQNNEPGIDPAGRRDNLHEVDVGWVRQPEPRGSDAFLVSVLGTGGWHQLTSWRVPSSGMPSEVATTPAIDGHHPKVRKLDPESTAAESVRKFVSGRIRDNGDFWLSSRALSSSGNFVHYKSIGYGINADVNVFDYDIAQRAVTEQNQISHFEVATPLLVKEHGSPISSLRVITWRVDALTGRLTALSDSGALMVFDLPDEPDDARIGVAHIGGSQYEITYTSESGSLTHRAFWTSPAGEVVEAGGGTLAFDIRGANLSAVAQEANAVAGLTSSGYLTAVRVSSDEMKMAVWERRVDPDDGMFDPYLIANNHLDLTPDSNGVFPAAPILTDSWGYLTGDGDHLGQALAVGDFDGDGYRDLAIGAPSRDSGGHIHGGAVYIIGGTSAGLQNEPYESIWTQDSDGIAGVIEVGDLFGFSLASGDFNGDAIDDLAIGAPGEDVETISTAGAVNVLYGTPFGLSSTANQIITQATIGHVPQAFDYFGWALAAGDFNGDGIADLAISAPNEVINGVEDGGAVYAVWGTGAGLSLDRSAFLHQDVQGRFDQAEELDWFGRSLTAGDFNGDSTDDLAVGIPYEDIGVILNAGAVQVFYGANNVNFGADIFVSQGGFANGEDIIGAAEQNDLFGSSLASGDFDNDGAADLAIGVPGEAILDVPDSGAVNVLYGSFLGLTWIDNLLIEQDEFNPTGGSLPGSSEPGDDLGRALSTGDFDGDGIDDLIVGAPHKGISNGPDDAGAVFFIRGDPAGLGATGSRVLHQESVANEGGEDFNANGSSVEGDQFGAALAAGDFNGDGESDLAVGIPYKDRDDHADCGAVQIIPGSELFTFTYLTDEEWFAREVDVVRAKVSDLAWEQTYGSGAGQLYVKDELLERRHVASVTKTMTLLLAVEAIEDGQASLDDLVDISELAGGTGGSKLATYDAAGDEITEDNGDEIPFIQPGDTMPLRLLLAGMMNESCNRSSVAIGQHIADKVKGDPDDFIIMMNERAGELSLNDSVFGHPAGGWVTTVQDMITLMREGVKHPLFVTFGGAETEVYGLAPPHDVLCGSDQNGDDKCNGPFSKFGTIGPYLGRLAWKGGNGGLWWDDGEANDVPARPGVAWCSASAVGVSRRLDRSVAISIQQTGERTEDCQRLFDFGFRKLFAPDLRGVTAYPEPGGLIGPDGPIRVRNFAIDRIDPLSAVTAIIDDNQNLQLNVWHFDFTNRKLTSSGMAKRTYALQDGARFDPPTLVDVAGLPGPDSIQDFFSANLEGDHLELAIWRVGEEP